MLSVSNLSCSYGAIEAVRDVSLEVADGALCALIGSNGAGKTTTIKAIMGLLRSRSEGIVFGNHTITGWPTYRIVRSGVGYVPEGRMVVAPLTVAENLSISASRRASRGSDPRDRVLSLFPRLAERLHQVAGSMSGGEQQMLALGRALMTEPDLLLLDEPSMGLSPAMVDTVFDAIVEIHRQGTTVLLVEQNAALALEVATHCYVVHRGEITLSGVPTVVASTEEFASAYLG